MFSKFERSAASGERGNAAVVALCVTTLAVGVVMAMRLLSGSSSPKPAAPIAATNIGAGESDADPSGARTASSDPLAAASSSASDSASVSASGGAVGGSSPVPTLPGSVPTIPPEGAVPLAAPVPVVAVTPTTTPPVILGLKTPQSASRNLFDAWKENDRARALRFASAAAVDSVFRTPWGAEVQDDGCAETSSPTSFHCAFVGDEFAWIIVVDQRIGPTGREFVPTRTMKTGVKSNSAKLLPSPDAIDPTGTSSSPSPTTTIDPLAGDDPLVDPASTPDLADPAIIDPSLLDPAGAAAALAESTGDGASVGSGAKPSASPTTKPPKKKKSTVRRPKSAVSSSKSAVSTDVPAGAPKKTPTEQPAQLAQPAAQPSGGVSEPVAPTGGAVKAGAPPVNQVEG